MQRFLFSYRLGYLEIFCGRDFEDFYAKLVVNKYMICSQVLTSNMLHIGISTLLHIHIMYGILWDTCRPISQSHDPGVIPFYLMSGGCMAWVVCRALIDVVLLQSVGSTVRR